MWGNKWCKFIPSRIMGSNKDLPDFWIHFCSLSSIWGDMKCAECLLSGNIAFGRIIKQSHYFIQFHCAIGKEMLCATLSWQQNVFTMLIIGEPWASCHNLYFSQELRFLKSSYTNVCFPRCYACWFCEFYPPRHISTFTLFFLELLFGYTWTQ